MNTKPDGLSGQSGRSKVIKALTEGGPMTVHTLTEKSGVKLGYLRDGGLLVDMVSANQIHISSYLKQPGRSGRPSPVYSVGPGVNADRPPLSSKPAAMKSKEWRDKNREYVRKQKKAYRERIKKDLTSEVYMREMNRSKAKYAKSKYESVGLAGMDPVLAAIMGVPGAIKNGEDK